jgi:hypothetical protein
MCSHDLFGNYNENAVLVLLIQNMCNSYGQNPKPRVKIEVNTNIHVCVPKIGSI